MRQREVFAYAAGIMDGEGTICIRVHRHLSARTCKRGYYFSLQVSVVNTQPWLMYWFKMQFGGHINQHHSAVANHKPSWQWALTGQKAVEFLELVLPYLQLKRPQAELAMEFQGCKPGPRGKAGITDEESAIQEAKYIMMGKMNKKGTH